MYDHDKYYMPLLGFPISQEIHDVHEDLLAPASYVHEDETSMSFVKAVVRSVKRSPTYMRIEFEDPTGSFTVFSNLDTDLKKRDYVYALIGDRTLQCFNDVEDEGGEAVKLMQLIRSERDHDHAWLYGHGLGSMDDSKALVYVVNVRQFKTSKGKQMASVYVWDGMQFAKIVIFPHMYGRYAQKLGRIEGTWVAVKPTPISNDDPGFKVDGTDDIIDIDDFCRRMKINVSS